MTKVCKGLIFEHFIQLISERFRVDLEEELCKYWQYYFSKYYLNVEHQALLLSEVHEFGCDPVGMGSHYLSGLKEGWAEFLNIQSLYTVQSVCVCLCVRICTLNDNTNWLTVFLDDYKKWNAAFHIITFSLLPSVSRQNFIVTFGKCQKWLLMTNSFK